MRTSRLKARSEDWRLTTPTNRRCEPVAVMLVVLVAAALGTPAAAVGAQGPARFYVAVGPGPSAPAGPCTRVHPLLVERLGRFATIDFAPAAETPAQADLVIASRRLVGRHLDWSGGTTTTPEGTRLRGVIEVRSYPDLAVLGNVRVDAMLRESGNVEAAIAEVLALEMHNALSRF